MNHDSDSEEEIYWEVVEAVTNCESESEEEIYWESLSQVEEVNETVINHESDPEEEIYWDSSSRIEEENVTTRGVNAPETPMKDETYEFNDEQIRKARENIYESTTFENALRLSKDNQKRKIKSRKELITKFILFSIIIEQVTIAKEIGGMMVQNKIQKGNLPSQYLVEQSDEEMIREQIDEEIIRAYNCMEESMSNAEISLNPPSECRIEDGSA